MPKPQNEARKNTTILVSKRVKHKIRACANPSDKRKGYETDEQVVERIIDQHISANGINPEVAYPTY